MGSIKDNNDNDWSVSVYKAEQKPPKRKVKLKNNKVKTKFKKTGVKCQPIIEPVENIENDDNHVKPKRQTKSEAISKMKCEAIIEPINEDEPFINNYRKRRKSKFPKLVLFHIQYFKPKEILIEKEYLSTNVGAVFEELIGFLPTKSSEF